MGSRERGHSYEGQHQHQCKRAHQHTGSTIRCSTHNDLSCKGQRGKYLLVAMSVFLRARVALPTPSAGPKRLTQAGTGYYSSKATPGCPDASAELCTTR